MGAVASRESYFETGLDVLSDLGYGGLKLAEVCQRLGVTTGSFYHYFPNWTAYTSQLVAHWRAGMTCRIVESVQAETGSATRIDRLIQAALTLPHGAEAAIRVWSRVDPQVRSVQAAVDRQRFDIMYESAFEILREHAAGGVVRGVGGVRAGRLRAGRSFRRTPAALEWIAQQLRLTLDSGRFTSVPDGE